MPFATRARDDIMQFEFDPERLIEAIEKRPGLWDSSHQDYKSHAVKHELWTEVVTELDSNATEATKSELRELEIQLQKKWKGIRDCYIKYLANPNRTKRPYIYSKQLAFLGKDREPNQDEDGAFSDSGNRKRKKWNFKKTIKVRAHESEDENDSEEDIRSNNSYELLAEIPAKSQKNERVSDPQQFAFASVDTICKNDDNDPDRLFLLSLLPHLKAVPENFRLNVKMEMMQVLQNASFTRDHKNLL